jgi:small subunit ribosomal protein S8e
MGISRDNRTKRRATGGKKKHFRKSRKLEIGRQPALTKLGDRKVTVVRTRGGNSKLRAIRLDAGNFGWGSEAIARKSRILGVKYNPTSNELVRTNTLVKNSIIEIDATPFRQWYEQHYGVTLGKTKKAEHKKKVMTPKEKNAFVSKLDAISKAKYLRRDRTQQRKQRLAQRAKGILPYKAGKSEKSKARFEKKTASLKKALEKEKAEKAKTHAAEVAKKLAASAKKRQEAKAKRTAKNFTKPARRRPARDAEGNIKLKLAARQKIAVKSRVAPIDPHVAEQFQQGRLFACITSRPGQDGVCDGYVLEGKELEFYLKKMQKKKAQK